MLREFFFALPHPLLFSHTYLETLTIVVCCCTCELTISSHDEYRKQIH